MAKTTFTAEVLTPEGEVFKDEVEMVSTRTTVGSIGILAHHQPLLGMLDIARRRGWLTAPPALEGRQFRLVIDDLGVTARFRCVNGRFKSTPHRVMNRSGVSRLSFPLFFDPDFTAPMRPLPDVAVDQAVQSADRAERWDQSSVHAFEGTYGDYLLSKVAKVFPQLAEGL